MLYLVENIPTEVRMLFVSDASFNQMINVSLENHPSRFRFIGDRVLNAAIAAQLFDQCPTDNAGQLTQKISQIVSATNYEKIFVYLKLGTHATWAISQRQKAEALEHVVGLLYNFMDVDFFENLIGTLACLAIDVASGKAIPGVDVG